MKQCYGTELKTFPQLRNESRGGICARGLASGLAHFVGPRLELIALVAKREKSLFDEFSIESINMPTVEDLATIAKGQGFSGVNDGRAQFATLVRFGTKWNHHESRL